MKVIFKKNVSKVAKEGEVKEVANGYARNYLLPRNLAVPATPEVIEKMKEKRILSEKRRKAESKRAQELVKKLKGKELKIPAKVSQGGKLFASIRAEDIKSAIKKEFGAEVNIKNIKIEKPIKEAGEHIVELNFGNNLKIELKLIIENQ